MELGNKIMKNDQMHLWVAFNDDFNVHLKSLGLFFAYKIGSKGEVNTTVAAVAEMVTGYY